MASVKSAGSAKRYLSGKPCPRGHVAERNTANGTCVECTKENNKIYKGDKARHRRNSLKRNYALTEAEFAALLAKQEHKCAVCGTSEPPKHRKKSTKGNPGGWQIDHDHATGAVRGVLCSPCNMALGFFHDNVDRLVAAIKYLVLT